ncbi:glycine--tRNA ligase subunit beta [Natroniella sulfidigena]|uniref:glycine--tRNA ligase subunit beta n=1 Tax=Natroniella sulfidigena TaxID=723921 RepID=UPI00200AE721|nr:glycine--tRNA ligase subunit beta [Natroniella sulfidigena]MCK8815939.1 glycine--tRNA ligase subunit beta [Natroniella sulfidigena]
MSNDLLLEVGTEEIPAGFMEGAFEQLERLARDLFTDNRVEIGEVKATGTPRRLALYIKDVAEQQSDLKKEVRGPAKSVAFDESGNPTKAGAGFARGQGITPEELEIRDTENGEYVFAVTVEEGKATTELLSELLVKIIKELNFPKSMRWANQELRFARPIKWLLALYGTEKIDLSLAGVESDNWTLGHRFLSDGQVKIDKAATYFDKLEEEYVIADHLQRREMIVEQIKEIGQQHDVEVVIEEELLHEVNFLVEYPTALCGKFEEEFLQLPEEVLITSMREHQRYFPVKDEAGELKNMFVTVRNGTDEYIDTVRAGNEKVLRARLSDGIFFYQEDQKEKLEEKLEELKDIIFQKELGTLYEKVERMVTLAEDFGQLLELSNAEIKQAKRAAKLAKADLVTEMVNEFAKLQGTMGKEYALLDGEDEEVAQAIFEHYLPRHATDQLPGLEISRVISIADKIDNIVGCFSVGIIPTGSQDPYALRRQAQGIVKIIVDAGLNLKLDQLIDTALDALAEQDKLEASAAEVKEEVLEFFKLRLENLLEEAEIRYDVSDAVLATNYYDVNDTLMRADAVMEFRGEEGFEELITAFNRASNLAAKAESEQLDPELFEAEATKELYSAYQEVKEEIEELTTKKYYLQALQEVAKLKGPIDNFFNSVMVMTDDQQVKNNRLGLLKVVSQLLSRIADLTKIVID